MAVTKMEHVGIMVSNMEESIAFYEKMIGLQLKDTLLHTNGAIHLAFLGFRNTQETEVELIAGFTGQLASEGRVHHVAFTVDDIEAEYERMRSAAAPQLDAEITTLPNGSRYFFFRGPDAESIEFFQSSRS
jgi:lactoylglutathione lyase